MTPRRTGAKRVAATNNRNAAGRNATASSSSTSRRSGASWCSTAESTIGPKAVCASVFGATVSAC